MKYSSKWILTILIFWPFISIGQNISAIADSGGRSNFFGYEFTAKSSLTGIKSYRVIEENDSISLKLLRVDSDAKADAFIGDRLAIFKSIFEARRVDYPGQYSKVIECPKEFTPEFSSKNIDGGVLSYFVGYANKNKVAGGCTPDQLFYKQFYGLAYCKNKSAVYEIEGFFDLQSDNLTKLISNISCID